MFNWSDGTPFTVRDMTRSVSIMGAPGSGKSTGSCLFFALSLFALGNSGGLILASKPEDFEFWQSVAAKTGRSDDLIIFSPKNDRRMNFLEVIGGDAREKTDCIQMIGDVLKRGDSKSGDEGIFWAHQKERCILLAIIMLQLAGEPITAPNIQRYIITAATTSEQLSNEKWRASYHSLTNARAFANPNKTEVDKFDLEQGRDFWLQEWPTQDPKTRSNTLATVLGVMSVYNSGIVRQLVSTTTNVIPDHMNGKFILVNMPLKEYGESGRFVMAGFKYICQRWILKRHAQPGDGLIAIVSDEFQNIMSTYDTICVDEMRSHLACMMVMTQSLHSYYRAMPGEKGKSLADGFNSAIGTRIFHRLGDAKSAEYASSLLDKYDEVIVSESEGDPGELFDQLMGHSKYRASYTTRKEWRLPPSTFLGGLATGGPDYGMRVQGIVIAAEPFKSTGERWFKATFDQRM
jgi:type IV secretory pathway TraG/TraD family ATPase VirD4